MLRSQCGQGSTRVRPHDALAQCVCCGLGALLRPTWATVTCFAGYTSVAHYLVLNNLHTDAKPVALERGMCPPELAGVSAFLL